MGQRPVTCPYWAFLDRTVREVLDAYGWFESGQVGLFAGDDPPNILVEAIGIYHRALNRIRAHDLELARQNTEPRS